MSGESLGRYRYGKRLNNGDEVECTVEVFPLEVTAERDRWPERHQRQRRWFSPEEAARLVAEPELREILLSLVK